MSSKALPNKGLDCPLLFLKGFDGLFFLGTRGTRCARASYSFHRPSEQNPLVQHLLTKKSSYVSPYEPFASCFEIHAAALRPGAEIFCLQVHISRSVVVVAHVVDDEGLGLFVVGVDIGDISICGSNRMERRTRFGADHDFVRKDRNPAYVLENPWRHLFWTDITRYFAAEVHSVVAVMRVDGRRMESLHLLFQVIKEFLVFLSAGNNLDAVMDEDSPEENVLTVHV